MKIRKSRFTGPLGNESYVNGKYGQVVRRRPSRPPRPTAARLRSRGTMSRVAPVWRKCTEKQFAAWTAAAKKAGTDGFHLFCKINCALVDAGLPLVMDPPKFEKIGRNPIGKLEIRNRGGLVTLRLRVPRAPAEYTFVLGSRAVSAGRMVWSTYSTLGRLPAAVRDWIEITELYVNKFGVPPVGARVFIRTRQLINGWKDDFKDTNAVVPPPEEEGS